MSQTFTFTFPAQAVQTIVNGLMELPAKVSLPIIQEIEKQAQAQLTAQSPAPQSHEAVIDPI